jgi:hypothetical protein
VGSTGVVDVADLPKVEFRGSVVRLHGIYLANAPPEPMIAGTPGIVKTQAVIRYQVAPNVIVPGTNYGMNLFCRRGYGDIAARVIQIYRPTPEAPAALNETPVCTLTSQNSHPLSFVLEQSSDNFQSVLVNDTYYVEVTLTAYSRLEVGIINPPELGVVEIVVAQTA